MSPEFGDDADYYNFRLKVCQYLPSLKTLDGFEVAMNDMFIP